MRLISVMIYTSGMRNYIPKFTLKLVLSVKKATRVALRPSPSIVLEKEEMWRYVPFFMFLEFVECISRSRGHNWPNLCSLGEKNHLVSIHITPKIFENLNAIIIKLSQGPNW